MPSPDSSPNFALLTECDLRDLSGVNLYRRSTTNINITMADVVYLDLMDFLHGYSATQSIVDVIEHYAATVSSPTVGDWLVSIDDNDKIFIRAGDPFDVAYSAGTDFLGIGSSTVSAVLVGSKYIATMPLDWVRGRVLGPWSFTLTPNQGSPFTVIIDGEYQDLRVAIRNPGAESDADDANATLSLSHIDTTIMGLSGLESVRWLIDEQGHAVVSYPAAVTDLTWSSTALRNLLGFTGDETPTALGGSSVYERMRSTFPCAMVLLPTRPVDRHQLGTDTMATARRRLGGGQVSNRLATYITSRVSFYLDAAADSRDLYQHWGDRFIPYTGPGQRLTYVGEWGDSRRHSPPMAVIDGAYTNNRYGELYTIQPERGRYIGRLNEAQFDLTYPGRLNRRVPLALSIEHDEVR
tara:strand:+ start:3401 stop:4627 length:1227 start_codon:yes stop_codon:yes gene_type:complete